MMSHRSARCSICSQVRRQADRSAALLVHPLLLQFGGSLIAILALAALAAWLRLGGKPTLADDEQVRLIAGEVEHGFQPLRIGIGRDRKSALVRDDAGRIMVIRRHGNKFVGRVLSGRASVREEVDALVVDIAEPRFGSVRLSLGDPAYWADAINRLQSPRR